MVLVGNDLRRLCVKLLCMLPPQDVLPGTQPCRDWHSDIMQLIVTSIWIADEEWLGLRSGDDDTVPRGCAL